MLRLFQATAVFFRVLGNRRFSAQIKGLPSAGDAEATSGPQTESSAESKVEEKIVEKVVEKIVQVPAEIPEHLKSIDALTFLKALQRDARMVDFLMEDIGSFTDEQVGAAVRDIHGRSQGVLQHFFDIQPLSSDQEGASVEVPSGYDAGAFTLIGSVAGSGPWKGTLQHPGWQASKVEIPTYTGTPESARIVSPTEVEVN